MSDITTTRIFTDGERGITAAKLNDIVGSSTIQPAFYTSKPTAGTADPADIALILKAGAYAQVPISALAGSATQAQIWSTRLRSYNSLGNPNFEVDQRNVGSSVALGNGLQNFVCDRWFASRNGTMTASAARNTGLTLLPGTNYDITNGYLTVQLTAQQASLGAGDYLEIVQIVEGSQLRPLYGDVHSLSLLVSSSVAGLKFSVALIGATKTLCKLCIIPAANQPTLIQLPNLPVFTEAASALLPGNQGYLLCIGLAAGSSHLPPANDTWQTGGFIGAVGMDNFASKPVNSTFSVSFIQHEPGAVCSILMDKPFSQNYDECLRYYQKSYDYLSLSGSISITDANMRAFIAPSAGLPYVFGSAPFYKPMAKNPTVTIWNAAVANAPNSIRDGLGVDHAVTAIGSGSTVIDSITMSPAITSPVWAYFHYTADTGW